MKAEEMSCEGCIYLHIKCILDAPNNCIRDAEDYYTEKEKQTNDN